jgi:hypothetical protein
VSAEEVKALKKRTGLTTLRQDPDKPLTTWQMYVDYSGANNDDLFFVFQFCTNFNALDTNLNYLGVTVNDISGEYDPSDPQGTFVDWNQLGLPNAYPTQSFTVTFDSIFALFSHENNSGNDDTVIIALTTSSANGTPQSTIVWADTTVTNTSISPSGNWLGQNALVQMYSLPNHTTNIGQKLSMVMYYKDPSKTDSLGMLGGSQDDGNGSSLQTNYQTSYMRYPPFINAITKCANITYTNGTYYSGQNWGLFAHVTLNYGVGMDENFSNGIKLSQNVPNPFKEGTMIVYELENAVDVKLEVFDVTGKVIKTFNEGTKSAGQHGVEFKDGDLQSGIYFYTLTAGGHKMTKRMNVVR